MADKKIEKALYGPSTIEVLLGAILGLIAGVLVACVYLVFKPVQQVRELPKEPVRGVLYYLPGSELSGKSRAWTDKQQQLLAGGNVELVEDELNAWSTATFGQSGKGKAGDGSAAPADSEGIVNPGAPNFKLTDGSMQIGGKVMLNWYGVKHEVIFVANGGLEPAGGDFEFVPRELFLGSCPIHFIPGAMRPLMSHLVKRKPVSDDLKSAWAKLTGATIDGSTLKLTMQ